MPTSIWCLPFRSRKRVRTIQNMKTVGAGFKMNVFSLDAAYVVATAKSNPLDQTLRFTLSFDMDGLKDLFKR